MARRGRAWWHGTIESMAMLTDFEALSFDCYGTLIDWETGIWDALQPLIGASGRWDVDVARPWLWTPGRHPTWTDAKTQSRTRGTSE